MLSGKEILNQMSKGNIVIEPFDMKCLNPNSYNLTLDDELLIYTEDVLDVKKENAYKIVKIPPEGYTLVPGEIYVAKTREYTENKGFIPQLSGRSSIGRIGLSVHITAGFGANGFKGNWILSLNCTRPLTVFSGIELCQIYYFNIVGDDSLTYQGKYANTGELTSSKIHYEYLEKNL